MSELEPTEVEERRAARERALELLYEAEIKGSNVDDVLGALPVAPAELAVELVRGVAAHVERIDGIVARRVAPRWTLARLAAVDRAILRLGTYELLERPDRSQAVVINEAVLLARRFGSDDSPRFVNGVLSAVADDVRGPSGSAGDASAGATDLLAPASAAGDAAPAPSPASAGGSAAGAREGGAGAPGVAAEPAPGRRLVRSAGAPQIADAGEAGGQGQVEALVIDLDGVIRRWDDGSLTEAERSLGVPDGAIGAAAFAPERLQAAMRGDLSFEEWCASLGEAVAAAHGVAADAVAKAFSETRWEVDDEVLAVVDRVRERVPVALLSNASSRLVEDLRRAGLAERFDAVVGSADIGRCKPDAEAFTAAADRLGVAPDRCLMVDDLPENVDGARAAGMRAVRYTDVAALRDALTAAGLLDPGP